MDLDRGRFVDPHHPVIVEVALLTPAFGDRDLVIEGSRTPEDEAALDLRLDAVGVDGRAAIDRRRDAPDRDLAVVIDLRLHDRRGKRAEHALAGHPVSNSRGKRASPARLFRRKIETGEKPRLFFEMGSPEGDRILPRGMRQLVDETLDDEDIVAGSPASPKAGRHGRRFGMDVFDVKVRRGVGKTDRAVDRVPVYPVLEGGRRPARQYRRASDLVTPRRDPAVR